MVYPRHLLQQDRRSQQDLDQLVRGLTRVYQVMESTLTSPDVTPDVAKTICRIAAELSESTRGIQPGLCSRFNAIRSHANDIATSDEDPPHQD